MHGFERGTATCSGGRTAGFEDGFLRGRSRRGGQDGSGDKHRQSQWAGVGRSVLGSDMESRGWEGIIARRKAGSTGGGGTTVAGCQTD